MTTADIDTPLRGTVARLVDLYEDKLPIFNLYGPEGAAIYDNLSRNDRGEVSEFLRVGGAAPQKVLELACGNGRTTLPLLEAGWDVTGLDSSPGMLGRLAKRLEEPEWRRYRDKLETVEADMTEFALDRTFDLVVLGTSTVWLLDAEGRAKLFERVYRHLDEGGRFLVTLMHYWGIDGDSPDFERTTTFIGQGTGAPGLCTLYDWVGPAERLRTMTILVHQVEDGQVSNSAIHTTSTNLITPSQLAAELEASGLHLIAEHEVNREQLAKQEPGGRHWVLLEARR